MASGAFKPNDAGFREMAVGPEIAAALLSIAERAKDDAVALSADFVDTGDYISSFNVRTEIAHLPFSTSRSPAHDVAAAILENTSDHAAAVEWGNKNHPTAHRVLGRVLDGLNNG